MERLHQSFRRAESQLISVLERRKGEVKTFYGDLMMTEVQYGGSRGRRWKVDWDRTPQPIQVKLKCLRGVKDKLPRGRYVMMVSLYDRLSGNILRWSKMKGQHWGGATLPVHHEGRFYNVEMKLDQSMFTVLPSKAALKPGMVVIFELYLLRGSVVTTDRVVGWGCFPICDAGFEVIEGKYRVPFLRGEMDPGIEKHETIERLISGELDHWLCNLYMEIVKLPRYLGGMKEYEVELEFSSAMTAYPDRRHTGGEEYRDGEAPMLGSQSDLSSQMGSNPSLQSSEELPAYKMPTSRTTATVSKIQLEESEKATMYGSRKIHHDKKLDLLLMEDSDPEDSDTDDVKAMKSEQEYKKVKHMPGMYYKKYEKNPIDAYHEKLFTILPKTAITEPSYEIKKLTHLEELERHTFSVQDPLAGLGRPERKSNEKMQYVGRQFLSELGISQWRGREFWGMMFMLIFAFFLRIYVHYIGQWFFLSAIDIPINMFNFLPYTVELNYQMTLLTSQQEIAVVALGPLFNLVVFIFLIGLCLLTQALVDKFPDFGCKLVMAFGVMTFLDPFLILAMDCILGRYKDDSVTPTADFAKLWYHFYRIEGSGLAGVFITTFLYLGFCFVTGAFLYMYFLRLHNNGRLLDIYWRLRGKEEKFFIPYDLEISNQELHYIVKKAEAWRGEEGERRKVAVFDYVWEEENMEDNVWNECTLEEDELRRQETVKEITTHVSIHTIHLDGLRELYRQFLRLPDGAVVEVFGDMAVPGMDKDIKDAMSKGTQGIEKLNESTTNLRDRKGRRRDSVNSNGGFAEARPASAASSSGSSIPKKKLW
ncbi:Orofacial cleft 1 candidate [Mactra antiquata]